jgi:hypothetical protein
VNQIRALAHEARILLDLEDHEDIAPDTAAWARIAAPAKRDVVAGRNAGRHVDFNAPLFGFDTAPVTRLAWIRDPLAFAAA